MLKVTGLQNGTLILATGQTLRGTGKIDGKTTAPNGSSIAPGYNRPGTLVLRDNVSMNAGASLEIGSGGNTVGSYGQVDVTGAATLGSATLNLTQHAAYAPKIGDVFMIVKNDAADATVGTFVSGIGSTLAAGTALPEGADISTDFLGSGLTARISYQGGDGNDVAITILPPPGAPVFNTDPINGADADVDAAYIATLAGSASDLEGDPLTFSKISGPSWMGVADNGSLYGTPSAGDLGANVFTVQVSDDNGGSDTATLNVTVVPARLVGQWDFNDDQNLTMATIESDLTLNGSHAVVSGNGALDGAARIGVGSFYSCSHGIGGNGGGSRTNEFTLVIDLNIPNLATWISLLDTSGGGDGDYFYSSSRGLGISSEGYVDDNDPPRSILASTWHRLVLSIDHGTLRSTYVDGVLIGNHGAGTVDNDRWSLNTTFDLFSDNGGGEEAVIDVTAIRLYNVALSAAEIATLGGVDLVASDDSDMDDLNDQWEITHYGSLGVVTAVSDTDHDGLTTFEEMVFAGNPHANDTFARTPQNQLIDDAGTPKLELVFQRPKNHTQLGVSYLLQKNQGLDFDGWEDSLMTGVPVIDGDIERVTYLIPLPSLREFYRWKIANM